MVNLPKNCKVIYFDDKVCVKMVYATTLPVGEHDGLTVFANYKGKRYIIFEYNVKYQNNMPEIVRNMYFETKKKAMLFNRMKKVDRYKQEINILSNSRYAGIWDIEHLKNENQLPNPPKQLDLF
jgi:hypothetical protein